MPSRFGRSMMSWLIIIGLVMLVMMFFSRDLDGRRKISSPEFWTYAENGQIEGTITIREKEILGELREDVPGLGKDEPRKFRLSYNPAAYKDLEGRLLEAKHKSGGRLDWEYKTPGWWESLLPQMLIMVGVFLL
ncbi:MAG: hypothetical protein KAU28_11385, partial [Phycisphaerae bacterium]|nr:hypothetical protein [Phycisphaerae bacterium]